MEEAVEWLSCMKCVGGAMHKQTMSHLKKAHRNSHKRWVFMLEGTRCTNKQTSKEKEREGGRSRSNRRCCGPGFYVLLQTSWDIAGLPSLQGILGAFGDTE